MASPIEANLYEDLPKIKVVSICGPGGVCVDGGDYNEPFLSTRSVSTYPKLPTGERDGEPIADRLFVKVHENRAMIAVADGCNWGRRPQAAAKDAVSALSCYMADKQEMIRDLQDAGHFLLRSFAEAHKKIVAGKDDIWEAGTTTLCGVLCLELEQVQEGDPRWGILCANAGDCKAFIASRKTKEITDVTMGNRNNVVDGRDPGGRLGPYVGHGWPDLRNLRLYFCPCDVDDLIIVMSDGVHDNLDPQTLGKVPADLQLPNKTWEELHHDALLKIKSEYMKGLLKDFVFAHEDTEPARITEALISHCFEVTSKARNYMETGLLRQPSDYIEYPGKMDHTTCVTFVVGRKDHLHTAQPPIPSN